MHLARVRVFWTPSPSSDVISQHLVVLENGEEVVNDILSSTVSEKIVTLEQNSVVDVTVTVFDGTFKVPAHFGFVMPDLEQPLPVTGLGFEILEVLPDND